LGCTTCFAPQIAIPFQSILHKNWVIVSCLVVYLNLLPHSSKNKLSHVFFTHVVACKMQECNHNQMNQLWQKTQPQMGLLWTFWFFHRSEFLKIFFCNIFFKIFKIPPINYITCVNSFWINMNFLKVYKFC